MARRVIDARLAAVQVLTGLETGTATLTDELERRRPELADVRERGLLLELAAGTLRWLRAIDARLTRVSQRPIDELDPAVRAVLRVSVYQLRYLTRIPAHAVVHAGVETARRAGRARAAGFVNAVLRAAQRLKDHEVLPARPAPGTEPEGWLPYLGVTLSHPDWLLRRWVWRHGPEAVARWCLFNNASPTVTLSTESPEARDEVIARLHDAGIDATPAPYAASAIALPPGAAGRLPPDVVERVRIQDQGSQIVGSVAAACGGGRVLDLCASPGGKTLVVLNERRTSRPFVVACDVRGSRIALLADTLRGVRPPVPIVQLDARRPLPFRATFDTVIIDAPCSGLGTLRRDPDLKWSRRESDLPQLAAQALAILEHGADAVAPGGAVVYATCSSEPDENEAVVAEFLSRRPDFRDRRTVLPPAIGSAEHLIDAAGHLRTWPFAHELDAFFASVLVRT